MERWRGLSRRCVSFGIRLMLYAVAIFLSMFGASPAAATQQTPIVLASAPQAQPQQDGEKARLSPEERMARRFPQPVRVGDLIGMPVLDFDDSIIGYIRQVVRTPQGKIQLIVPYWRWFGWAGPYLDRYRRPVAVPIETVAILARQVNALEMTREDFDTAPAWAMEQSISLALDEKIRIALGRR